MDASKHSTLRQQRTVCRGARPRLLTTCSWPNRLAGEETCGALPGSVDLHIGQSILGTGASQCPLKVHVMQPFMTSPGMEEFQHGPDLFGLGLVFFSATCSKGLGVFLGYDGQEDVLSGQF